MTEIPTNVLLAGPAAVAEWLAGQYERGMEATADRTSDLILAILDLTRPRGRTKGLTVVGEVSAAITAALVVAAAFSMVANGGQRGGARDALEAMIDPAFDLADRWVTKAMRGKQGETGR